MKKSHFSIRKIVVLSIFLAISVVVSYVESFIPIPIPGVKLGLANVIILVLLYDDTIPNAFLVLIMRIFIVGLIRGSIFTPTWFMSAIKSYLVGQGVKASALTTEGMGGTQPVANPKDKNNNWKNRRVEFILRK